MYYHTMIIMGIDPGYDRVGVAVIEKEKQGEEKYIYSECIRTDASLSIDKRIFSIAQRLSVLCEQYAPKKIAFEKLFVTRNQKTAMGVAEARGVMKYVAHIHKGEIREYTPTEIKVAITGNGRATKNDITQMVPHLVHADISHMIDDEVDAIAVALTCAAIEKN